MILNVIENIGRLGIFIIPFFYSFRYSGHLNKTLLIITGILMFLYYIGWAKYFLNGRDYALLFSPLFFIPIPLAVFPILSFLLVSIVLRSYPLLIATIVFSIGHIPISYLTYLKTL